MIIELYSATEEHPALYDAYIDKEGNLYGMSPAPRYDLEDILQVVLEKDGKCPNYVQKGAIRFLAVMNRANGVYLFRGAEMPTALHGFIES